MTQVDFHILQDTNSEARWLYACRFVEKVASLGHNILIAVDTKVEAQMLDELLWSFKPESFIPHHLVGDENKTQVEITYTVNTNNDNNHDSNHDSNSYTGQQQVLVNISSQVPDYFSCFERLTEIVIQEPIVLEKTREHYKFYKQRGYPISQHHR
jgi:DNA polymerase III subunit chi